MLAKRLSQESVRHGRWIGKKINRFQGYFSLNYEGNKNKKQRSKDETQKTQNQLKFTIHSIWKEYTLVIQYDAKANPLFVFSIISLFELIPARNLHCIKFTSFYMYRACLIQPNKFPIPVVSFPVLRFRSRRWNTAVQKTLWSQSVILERITQIKQVLFLLIKIAFRVYLKINCRNTREEDLTQNL